MASLRWIAGWVAGIALVAAAGCGGGGGEGSPAPGGTGGDTAGIPPEATGSVPEDTGTKVETPMIEALAPPAGSAERAAFVAIQSPGINKNVNLYLFGADGKPICPLTSDGWNKYDLAVSPDRKWAAFVVRPSVKPIRMDVVVMNLETGEFANVTSDMPSQQAIVRQEERGAGADVNFNSSPSFTPDSRRVVFVNRPLNGCGNIFSANVDGSDRKQLTGAQDRATERNLYMETNHSPIGPEIVFSRIAKGGTRSLYVLNTDTGEERRLTENTEGRCERPRWSPDGKTVAFMQKDPEKRRYWNIWTIGADGKGLAKVNPEPIPADLPCLSWLPSGKKLAFVYREGVEANAENNEVYVLDLASRTTEKVSNTPMFEYFPEFLR